MTVPLGPAALVELRPWILTYARNRAVPTDDIEDVTQDVLLQAILKWSTFVPTKEAHSLRRWVAGIARNVVATYHRQARTRRRLQARYEQEEDPPIVPSHEERIVAAIMLAWLEAATTPERWAVLLDATEGELTAKQIGESWGASTGTIAWWLRLARADLAAALEREARPPVSPRKPQG